MQENAQTNGGAGFSLAFGSGLWSGKKSRIGTGWALGLIAAAGLCDLLSLIPFVGDFTAPIFWVVVSYILWKKGCGFLNYGRLATSLISMVAEMIPAIQELPLTLAGMILVILMVRFEDKTGIKVPIPGANTASLGTPTTVASAASAIGDSEVKARTPLNVDGVRAPINQEEEAAEETNVSKNTEPSLGGEPPKEEEIGATGNTSEFSQGGDGSLR